MQIGSAMMGASRSVQDVEHAGFTLLALAQVGADAPEPFISWAATDLLPALRAS